MSVNQSAIAKQFSVIQSSTDNKTIHDLKIKFNTAYCIGKEELSFTKFRPLLIMQKKNGLDITPSYSNDVKCAEMLSTVASTLHDNTADILNSAHFFSVLIDGATDSSISENEVIFARLVQNGLPINKMLDLKDLEHAHADGVITAIKFSLSKVGLQHEKWKVMLVGFCADGASVNLGQRNGVVAKLREDVPHLIDFHCMAHRLELALLQLQRTCPMVESVNTCLHLIWKTYHFSPKSKRELEMIGKELEARIYSPTPVKGTRWVPHIDRAMKLFLEGRKDGDLATDAGHYAAVFTHMESLATTSKNADIKGRGYKIHKQMKTLAFAAFCHFMADLFGELALVSLKLQSSTIILPSAISAIQHCVETVKNMKDLPNGKPGGLQDTFLQNVEKQVGKPTVLFQGIEMCSDRQTFRHNLSVAIGKTVDITVKELESRFQNVLGSNKGEGVQKAVNSFRIFHHDTWPDNRKELLSYGNAEMDVLCKWFDVPLKCAGCNFDAVQLEWQQLKMLISNSFKDKSYLDLWRVFLMKSPYNHDFANVLLIVELMLVLPISSAECERAFSAQKRIKSDVRSSLSVARVSDLILISAEGPELSEFDPSDSVNKWMSAGKRKPTGCMGQTEWSEEIKGIDSC